MANSNVNVIILADDCYKMKFYGNRYLLKIDKRSLIELQLEILIPLFNNITVIGGFQFSKLRKALKGKPLQLIENADFTDLNDSYSLQLALDHCTDSASLVLGNGVMLEEKLVRQLTDSEVNKVLLENSDRDSVTTNISENRLISFAYGLDHKYIPAIYLTKSSTCLYHKMYKAKWAKMFIFEMLNKLIDKEIEFQGVFAEPTDYIYISNLKDYKNTYEDFNQ